ncbi:MAG: hypothetical protein HZA66_08215 [Rhodopseudomonas palustris]|uniref:Transmembrane protein n=1 Tax=Rhodopseudomonas palustris TaxID=1076 RepID=A0A933W1L9_RHOPL|nr:hypothetical protein [Rhodopseudomonas palustris]
MSLNTKFAALALTAIVATGALTASTQAQAKGPGPAFGVAAGLIGAAVIGSTIAAGGPYYYNAGYRHCVWVPQYNYYGAYIGRVRACD